MSRKGDYAKYKQDPQWLFKKKMTDRASKYGCSVQYLTDLLEKQGWLCAICGRKLGFGKRGMHVDHDHETGAVRAWLCAPCNVGLGQFGDDPDLLEQALRYLKGG